MTANQLNPETWLDEYGDYLFNYALIRVSEKETAKDLVQETFLSALKAMKDFKGNSSEKTWLIAILKRKIIDHYRKASTRKETNTLDQENSGSNMPDNFHNEGTLKGHWKKAPLDWHFHDKDPLESDELQNIIESCIKLLPEKWAAVFVLKVMEECSSDDVCKELKITASNLWVILHRIRIQMRDCVEKKWLS